ncbi:MAG: adenosylcobinamide-GDP ribazoletransferase, partial [Desulfobulbaceae bacterium]|nr:adenosylcobinamide-GDP ribazoletransferase [Desulfobulbaceae bacterium]
WLTRGLHLDGLADVMDGFGGGFDRERRLAIMKDSSIGAFGAVGLILVLFFKVVGLESFLAAQPITVCPGFGFLLILLPPVAARWAMAILAYKSSYPRQAGTAGAIVGNVKFADLFLGGVMILPLLAAGWLPVIAVVAAVLLPSFLLREKAHSLLGGVTGDVLGASCELGEAAGWLVLSLVMQM